MLNLNNITLIGIDCIDVDRLAKAIAICEKYAKFEAIKLLTSQKTDYKYAVKIPSIKNIQEYSKFMIRELHNYVDTEFALCIQWDGFIVEPKEWTDEYLNYDFCGSPWWFQDDRNVGNGACSLRSKKFLEVCSKLPIKNYHPEDLILGRIYKNLLLKEGIKYAPETLAHKFGFEGNIKYGNKWRGNTFAFHDFQMSNMSAWEGYSEFLKTLVMNY